MGGIIAVSVLGLEAGSVAAAVVGFAINMVASSILSKVFAPDLPNLSTQAQPNPGNRQQLPPAGDNKLPVVYGQAYVGGIITDLSISSDNQDIYWVISLCEVTNTESGGTPDTITFGNVYWGGKLVVFGTGSAVTGLTDESTGQTQDVTGNMNIWLYKNGSNQPANTTTSAISVMQASNLIYTWDASKLMSNCAFAIVHIKYSQSKNLTGLQQTRFEVTNSRNSAGDCINDYLTSERYGAAIPATQVDTTSLTALNAYCNTLVNYINFSGVTSTQARFKFNGTLDTNLKIMQNIQAMADSCDCLIRYNEITAQWGVVIQKDTYTLAMALDDSNIISAFTVTPIDLANSFNIIECKFPDGGAKDTFASVSFDLSVIDPSLLFPNEPVNKQSVNLYLCNNNVQAQFTANRMLKAAREDLQLQCDIDFSGLQLEAGDIVSVTNANYGWVAKLFRIIKVIQKFDDTGKVYATLSLTEFNPAVYSDASITQFTPAPNTGIGSPVTFGNVPAPTIPSGSVYPYAANPSFNVNITSASNGITQYAELWYSAYQYPTQAQMIFAGTTAIQPNGDPYSTSVALPPVQVTDIPAGNWYFFSRMVNAIASSPFSPASSVFQWRPTTFQFTSRYVSVAYADDITGTGFSANPRNKSFYGLVNQTSSSFDGTAADYTWYAANPVFSTGSIAKYLAYTNRTGRKFSFATDNAAYAAGTASFVPTTTGTYDPVLWSALPDGTNVIDLDKSTGQVIQTGTTNTGAGQIAIQNTNDGRVVAALQQFLDFGGPTTYTASAATLTIDIYGRVVGFASADQFYMTIANFTATSGQTAFSVTRGTGYILGQCLVFQNGTLLDTSEYTDAVSTVTLTTGATLNDVIIIISMRALSTGVYYDNAHIQVASVSGTNVVWNSANMPYHTILAGDVMTFSNTGVPVQYTVSNVNTATQTITFTTSVTGVSAGSNIYFYRAAASSYRVFSRYSVDLVASASYTPTTWNIETGYELPFVNGIVLPDPDYTISGAAFVPLVANITGKLTFIQFTGNNLTTPTGAYVNTAINTVAGQTGYSFTSIANALNVYGNGVLLEGGVDYTSTTGSYTLATAYPNTTTTLLQQTFARYGAA